MIVQIPNNKDNPNNKDDGNKEIELEITGSNLMAATWIASALFGNLDRGEISSLQIIKVTKGKNSTDWVAIIGCGLSIFAIIESYILYLKGERNNKRRFQEMSEELEKILLPYIRAAHFEVVGKRGKLEKFAVEKNMVSKETMDNEVKYELLKYEEKDRKFLK